jgi:hypothetical protein
MRKLCLLLLFLSACSGITIDPSMDAYAAGDFTLISTCNATPGIGMDICNVTEGEQISSGWKLILPHGDRIVGGEVDVYYRNIHKTYNVSASPLVISFRDFFSSATWTSDLDGELLALVTIRWKDDTGIIQSTKLRGIAKTVVTKPGYDRMPIDSGLHAFSTVCTIQYSTAVDQRWNVNDS